MNKYRIGKLPDYAHVAENYLEIVSEFGADKLPINIKHAHYAGKIEWDHRDPFDRMLAAQAFVDNLTLVTSDPAFQNLPWITVLW
jgi:PIN domain nuclease of toxin-antitoxin system